MNKYAYYALKLTPKTLGFYNYCKAYVNKYNSENNCDMRTNGEFRFIKNNLPRCEIVFDIGANIGEWTQEALLINPKATIHCFEPSLYTYEKLVANTFPENIICNNYGLSSKKETLPLYIFEDGAGINSLYKRHGLEKSHNLKPQENLELIHLSTLENYCSEKNVTHIDFLKIDVEGHELEVFKGGNRLFLNNQISMIQFEYGGCNIDARVLLKDIFGFFKNKNYNLYKVYPQHLKLHEQYDQTLENFQYPNWVAIKKNYEFIP